MSNKIESVKKLKHIILTYDDGTAIRVPENKALEVGTAFMKSIVANQFQWEIVEKTNFNFINKLKKFFSIT